MRRRIGGRCPFQQRHALPDDSGGARSGGVFLHCQWSITVCHRAGPFAVDGQFRNFHPASKDQPVYFSPASATSIPTTTRGDRVKVQMVCVESLFV